MPHIVYILQSERDGRRYIGVTGNLQRRLEEHTNGCVAATRHRRPLRLIHSESFTDKKDAWKRERFFKSGQGRDWLRRYLEIRPEIGGI